MPKKTWSADTDPNRNALRTQERKHDREIARILREEIPEHTLNTLAERLANVGANLSAIEQISPAHANTIRRLALNIQENRANPEDAEAAQEELINTVMQLANSDIRKAA